MFSRSSWAQIVDNVVSESQSTSKPSAFTRRKASTKNKGKFTEFSGSKAYTENKNSCLKVWSLQKEVLYWEQEKKKNRSPRKQVLDCLVSRPNEHPSVYIQQVSKKDGSIKYDKNHHCLHCGQQVQKMSRRLAHKHSDQIDVAKALTPPKNSNARPRKSN